MPQPAVSVMLPRALRLAPPVLPVVLPSTATIDALNATLQAPVDTVALVVQAAVCTIPAIIEASLDAVTMAVEALRATIQSCRFCTLGAPIEPAVDAIAAIIQTRVQTIPAIVQAPVDAVATPVQPIIDPVSLIGQRRATEHQAGQYGKSQNRPVVHGPAPCGCVTCYDTQRGSRGLVDAAMMMGKFIVKFLRVRQSARYLASSRAMATRDL
jgi:hypothetical protein